ncbi:MAG: sucrose-6-phosphate hydrolase [Candidatus Izemoplasmatales bacterium]|nr:sucrose-6-phosphate hydrolase [Candidatus Izemoplasmatales bacterium]
MKKKLLLILFPMFLILLGACSSEILYQIPNGDFEAADLSGWTSVSGEATISRDVYYDGQSKYIQENEQFLTTKEATSEVILKSASFTLGGLGYVSFLISGDANSEDAVVVLYDALTQEEIMHETYTAYDGDLFRDNFIRVVWDLSDYLGQELYLQIEDTGSNYLNVDALDTWIETDEELQRYQSNVLERLGFMTDNLLLSAEYYLNLYNHTIDPTTRYTYHVMGEMGWINDPNGLVYYNDEYNVFYQHNPYAPVWGPMYWGHVTSTDMVKWEYRPLAVAPMVNSAGGGAAFSGSAIEIDGDLYLMYTENWQGYQYQVLSKSTDGIHFSKINDGAAVLDDSDLPFYANPVDFRDPNIFVHDGTYYSVIGSRQINDFGQVLLFQSDNLVDWDYVGPVIQGSVNTIYTLGYMFECPDLFELDGSDVLLMSPQEIPGHRNTHGTVYVVGTMNYQTGMLEGWNLSEIQEIDYGFDFYAPQTLVDNQGRRIMIAWMQSWNRAPMTGQFGWAGALTFPREIHLDESGHLIQYPIQEIENYRENLETYDATSSSLVQTGITGNTLDLELTFTPGEGQTGITVFADEEGNGTHIYYEDGYVYLNRSDNMGGRYPLEMYNLTKAPVTLNQDGTITLRILLDRYSVEVFVNGGERAITTTVYQSHATDGIVLFSDANAHFTLSKWDLHVE